MAEKQREKLRNKRKRLKNNAKLNKVILTGKKTVRQSVILTFLTFVFLLSAKQQRPPDPDLSELGGQAYRTCGSAYIVQRPKHGYAPPGPPTKEEKTLKRMEAEPELKDKQEDPMPTFTTVEQRMMDLNERKLHPLYKKYQVTPRRMYKMINKQKEYKTRSGPITPDDYPLHLKFNRELLEKKNMYAEYKKVEPPQQMVAKILEMRQNERPTLERKFPHLDAELQKAKARRNVYDTLNQKDSITEKYVDK